VSGRSRSRLGLVVLAVLGLLGAAMWIYVLFIGNPENIDKLNDAAYGRQAEPICAATVAKLQQLGVVNQKADSPQQRADLVDRSDAELKTMVAQLRTLQPSNSTDAATIGKWLGAWDQWLADRATWSAQLHAGQNVEFLETQLPDGRPSSTPLNDFALINGMKSCATPGGI
jgi:hypothetical protein